MNHWISGKEPRLDWIIVGGDIGAGAGHRRDEDISTLLHGNQQPLLLLVKRINELNLRLGMAVESISVHASDPFLPHIASSCVGFYTLSASPKMTDDSDSCCPNDAQMNGLVVVLLFQG